ncbi:ATP-binding protein [Streptomyces sp. NPDC054884]|uniref:ATP-binding protein n=1 Tax=Streptomyces sp. ME08-AFT2 TaxID=3028683 RepID=UPI0029AB46F4|nr:ATP-binding protein [Streptomyces sp. ME08-AFT2]MDX3309467.1 ATP-binding protein [Streptomyces sp. ME08-AFT2]
MSATTPQLSSTVHTFAQLLSSTRRGARLARLLACEQLRTWPVSPGVTERAEQIVAELASNAALHGRVGSRDFRLTLTLDTAAGLLRIAVTDARGERIPSPPADRGTPLNAESGRGLLLVTALADRWGVEPYPPGGKTVWAECTLETPDPDTHTGRLQPRWLGRGGRRSGS